MVQKNDRCIENESMISVIIPVYKVEPYLHRCLNSVVNQSYRNLEIVLVDDGSPDNCGTICDEYATYDPRIQVIHKENGGVSSARNAGLSVARGEWIGWIDSDDWIEPDMYEYLLRYAQSSGADIAVCGRYECYQNHSVFRGWEKEKLLNTEESLELLLKNDIMQNFLWDKLWRKELFGGITFPEGKTFEDIAVMHQLFERAKSTICLPEGKYHYFQRKGSILDDSTLRNKLNFYWASRKRYEEMLSRWPQFRPLLEAQCVVSTIGIWAGYYSNPEEERMKYRNELKNIAAFSQNYYKVALQHVKLGFTGRVILCLTPHDTWWAFSLAAVCGWLYKIKHGRVL